MKLHLNIVAKIVMATALAVSCPSLKLNGQGVAPQSKAANLFTSAAAGEQSVKARVDSDILKRRVVRINFGDLVRQTRAGGRFQINLFEGVSFEGVVEKVEDRSPNDYTLSGRLKNEEFSSFALSVKENVFAMNARTKEGGFYQIRYLGDGLHEVRQMDESKFPLCGTKAAHAIVARPDARIAADLPQGDAANLIDVMVVYTAEARAAAGGTSAMQALINLAVNESNTAYQQSLITPRIRLVYQGEISYSESGSFDTDLNRLTNPTDGFLDAVQGLRNTYGADLVSLWVDNSEYCGLGWLMSSLSPSFESQGFSACNWDCATGYYSFSHEMAHNMGCAHDRDNSGGPGLYAYSYGWRFNGTNGIQYRTIMSYAPGTRIQRFSNPNVSYLGGPTGVAVGQSNQSHNAQTINNTAATVANFRQTVTATNLPPVIYGQPQPELVYPGQTATFAVAAGGSATRTYYWRKAGATVSVTTNNSYIITNVQNADANIYSVIVSNAFGIAISSNASLTVAVPIPLGEALDSTGFTWTSGGTAPWVGQNATTHDGTDAAQSGAISHSLDSWLQATFTGPGTLTYWCKISSELNFDVLRLYANGIPQSTNSGEVDWIQKTVNLPAGNQVCRWTYSKDSSLSVGQDKAWVDQVSFAPSVGISLPIALDNSGFNWSTSGHGFWFGQSNATHDGIDAAQSGYIVDNQYSLFQAAVVGPGSFSFWWKVSSETNYDFLDFIVDGSTNARLSGEAGWTLKTLSVPAGTHTLSWKYSKDGSDALGQDRGWVDQIVYSGASSFLTATARVTNGQFQLQFSGLAGASYRLQASTNLINWVTLTNVVSSNVSNLFLDTGATNFKNRFYKIVSP
ncbi:MAG: M12 family metallo-peptidase [Verrucomicrobiota bacterium]